MFDPKQVEDTDNDILQEIIKMCEQHMGGGLKKPDEISPPIEEEVSEAPMEESAEPSTPDLEGADLEELMRMYESAKG